ncbi:hypothetical protein ColLi_12150 [Colletotrichum liriopes]|uniref:Uncharacterized protein n=1 Tax=Colletotrichum liriopes TaxID=708192 RepID=A0AA37GZT5_9PEZI|nr:hypothetical protein ColLi_12150 [Colletotrichum liriopes]
MTGTGTGGNRTNAGNGIGSDMFWSAVWRWAGLLVRSPTASILAFSTSAAKADGRRPRHAIITRLLISATRRAWGQVALPPLQAQSVAISTAVTSLNLGLKKLREQQWAEAR